MNVRLPEDFDRELSDIRKITKMPKTKILNKIHKSPEFTELKRRLLNGKS